MIGAAMSRGYNLFKWTHKRLNGEVFPAEVLLSRSEGEGGAFLQATVRDLTERKLAEEKVQRLSRIRAISASVADTVMRVRDPGRIYLEACRIAVETGGLRMAWVGLVDAEKKVKPAAQWGFVDGYLDAINISVKDIPEGRGPIGLAIRTGLPIAVIDMAADSAMLRWREVALGRGYASGAAFPLRLGSAVIGAYVLYSGEKGFFNAEEMSLFSELSANISFALESIETEALRRKAEEEAGKLHVEALERARRLEEQARELNLQTELAHTSERAKAAFLANMTHELNTPLNSIIGFSEVLADQAFGALNDKQKKYAGNILAGGKQLLAVIYSIFDLVRLDSDAGDIAPAVFALKDVLEEAVRLLEPQARLRGLRLAVEVTPPDCKAETDGKLLKQAVLLLLSNAVKFTPAGGQAGLRAAQGPAGFELTVWDTGIGLSGEDLARLFQPFQQLEHFETKTYAGIGVGLAVAQKIIKRLGGELAAASDGPGKGCAFKFTLPPHWGGVRGKYG